LGAAHAGLIVVTAPFMMFAGGVRGTFIGLAVVLILPGTIMYFITRNIYSIFARVYGIIMVLALVAISAWVYWLVSVILT